jgi:hypothetical protein
MWMDFGGTSDIYLGAYWDSNGTLSLVKRMLTLLTLAVLKKAIVKHFHFATDRYEHEMRMLQ